MDGHRERLALNFDKSEVYNLVGKHGPYFPTKS